LKTGQSTKEDRNLGQEYHRSAFAGKRAEMEGATDDHKGYYHKPF
jgi:hypothetical protein